MSKVRPKRLTSEADPILPESASSSADSDVSHLSRILPEGVLRPLARALIELALQLRAEEEEIEEAA